MNAWISPAALHQDVVAARRPSLGQSGFDNCATMTLALVRRMRHDVFQEAMASPLSQKIWCRDQHASGYDRGMRFGHEDGYAVSSHCLAPDISRALDWFYRRANVRCPKKIEQ
jgi:hypothetical protein